MKDFKFSDVSFGSDFCAFLRKSHLYMYQQFDKVKPNEIWSQWSLQSRKICGSIQLSQCLEGICTSTRTSCQAPARLTHLLVFTRRKKNFKIDWLSSSAATLHSKLIWSEWNSNGQNYDRLLFWSLLTFHKKIPQARWFSIALLFFPKKTLWNRL